MIRKGYRYLLTAVIAASAAALLTFAARNDFGLGRNHGDHGQYDARTFARLCRPGRPGQADGRCRRRYGQRPRPLHGVHPRRPDVQLRAAHHRQIRRRRLPHPQERRLGNDRPALQGIARRPRRAEDRRPRSSPSTAKMPRASPPSRSARASRETRAARSG